MREIKFRAWDKIDKEMININLSVAPNDAFDEKSITLEEALEANHRFIVIQYTGLKDKNGKEVYEGNIIKIWYDNRNKKYLHSKGMLTHRTIIIKWKNRGNTVGFNIPRDNFEVIGNIFENLELLERNK